MAPRSSRTKRGARALNIGEIARRAGVSRSTVSYALSGKRTLSEATRRRIHDVINELGYQPNAHARALKEGRTRTIGLVIPPAGVRLTDMQVAFVAGIVDSAARVDLDVLISSSGGDHDRSFERVISGGRVDGVVLMEVLMQDARVERLHRTGLPFVAIGRTGTTDGVWSVDIDYAALTARCVHHLADLGHRHIALINRPTELVAAGYGCARRAQDGFAEAVAERGMSGVELCCADDPAGGQACIEELLAAHPRVTAVATVNEAALPGIGRALERAGLVVPRDFSITGVAARHWAEDFDPPLTGAEMPAAELCAAAIELLMERINEPERPARTVLLAPPIYLRGSTGPANPRRRRATRSGSPR
jgi:DNA-binding LacI/PurR family transcriptional regulator